MSATTAGTMALELQRRIAQLSADVALAAINRAYKFICAAGSYTFLFIGDSGAITPLGPSTPDGPATATVPVDCDLGKIMHVANSTQGTPIEKRGAQDFSLSFAVNIPADQGFSTYTIFGRKLLLRPSQSAQNIGIKYHVIVTDLQAFETPLTPDEFDDTIVGFAEAAERRINDVGDSWTKLYEQKAAEIKEMLEAYRTSSLQTGSETDAQVAVQEKTSIGRG